MPRNKDDTHITTIPVSDHWLIPIDGYELADG
jgi:hypothetical protein